jgi:hypothetical protein
MLRLYPPRKGFSSNWRVRGTYLGVRVDQSSGTHKRSIAAALLEDIVGKTPPNDMLGLAITEGLEDALSVHEATGLGAWAAGAASRMPALADIIPSYIEVCTVAVDDDSDGRHHAAEFAQRLEARGIEARLIIPDRASRSTR